MLVLVVVETTDVIFAVDSIPAIFAITRDPFIVYTSNVFAILGLRALYFLLAGVMEMFTYLKVGLSVVLCFVGAKMMLVDLYEIPIGVSLGVVAGVLTLSVLASVFARWKKEGNLPSYLEPRQFLGSWSANHPNPATGPAFARVWPLIILIAVALMLVKWQSIATGPSAHETITVLRVVENELAQAQWSSSEVDQPSLLEAHSRLNGAWSSFEEKRYAKAISAADEARQLLGSLNGQD